MKPILFSTPMVQAILDGRKTMTRRVMKPQPDTIAGNPERYFQCIDGDFTAKEIFSPYGQSGDILWVRETFKPKHFAGQQLEGYDYKADHVTWMESNGYVFKSNAGCEYQVGVGYTERWKPSIFMPLAAARLFLKIKSVTVERLQDIEEADILAEGVRYNVGPADKKGFVNPVFKIEDNSALSFMPDGWEIMREKELTPILLFAHWAELWCKINGRQSWDANPWVWVVSFERTEKPI